MKCPKCGHNNSCPCTSCQSRNPTSNPWRNVENYIQGCGNCEYEDDAHVWMDICDKEYEETGILNWSV